MLDRIFSQHPTIYKYDRTWIGVVLGLIVPTMGIFLVFLLSVVNRLTVKWFGFHLTWGDNIVSIRFLLHNITSVLVLTKFLSVGCILNLGVFFIFINRDYFNIARGVIFATMLVALPIIIVTIRGWFI